MHTFLFIILAELNSFNNDIDFRTYDDVIQAFVKLTATVSILLRNGADFNTVRRSCLSGAAHVVTKNREAIMSSNNFDKLFDTLATETPYWSWIDIRLLEAMVTASGIQAAVKLIENYKEAVYGKNLKDVLPNILNKKLKEDYFTTIVSKVDMNPDKITVAVLLTYRSELEEVIMDINKGTLVLENVKKGCMEVHWYIPNCYVDTAFNNACKNCSKFYVFHLLKLKIGNNTALVASGN